MGRLTPSVNDTTLALDEEGEVLGYRQIDMGNPGF